MAARRIEISTGAVFFLSLSLFLRLYSKYASMLGIQYEINWASDGFYACLTHTCMCAFLTQGWQIEEVELKLPSPTLATTSQWCNSTCTCVYVCLTDDSLVANGLRCTEDLIKAYIFPFFSQFISILCNLQKQVHTHTNALTAFKLRLMTSCVPCPAPSKCRCHIL